MTVLVQRGTTVIGTTGTTWANETSAVDGAPGTSLDTFATWTTAGLPNAVGTIELGGYDFSSIPAGSVINSVTLTLREQVSSTVRMVSVSFQAFDGSTAIGSPVAGTLNTVVHNDTGACPATLAQLKSAGFKTRVTFTRAGTTTTAIGYVDAFDISVDYTAGAPASRAKRWDGSAWVDAPVKRYDGSAYVDATVKRFDGSAWV